MRNYFSSKRVIIDLIIFIKKGYDCDPVIIFNRKVEIWLHTSTSFACYKAKKLFKKSRTDIGKF